jgi:hypothetical protein
MMKKRVSTLFSVVGILLAFNAYAGKDPIAWSLSPSGGFPASTTVGSSYAVTYTMTNNLPFAVPLTINTSYTGGSFVLANGCNKTLAPKGQSGSSCLAHLSLQPIKTGQSTARVTLAYHNNRVPLPLLSSTASSVETQDKISGHVTRPLPPVTYTGTSYPVAFSFVNNGTVAVTATAVNISGFTATSNQCTSQLSPNSPPCVVSGTYSPVSAGSATLGVTYVYNSGGTSISIPLTTQTQTQNGSGPCHDVSGFVTLPLPVNTYIYADNVVQYTFTNNCDVTSETLGTVSIASDSASTAPTLTKGTDNCSGATLSPNASCSIYVSVIPNSITAEPNDLTVTASIPYNSNTLIAHAATSEVVSQITNQSSLHTMVFVNQCTQNVWYAFQNGTGGGKSPDPTPPANRSWQGYQLNQQLTGAAPAVKVLQFSAYNGGSIVGRTGCDTTTNPKDATYGTCITANCTSLGNSTGTCNASIAPSNPATVYEQDINSTPATDGVYDVSLINGFNIPGEFRSLAPLVTPLNFNHACGQSSGAIIQPSASGLPICPWTFSPPSTGTDCSSGTQTDNPSNYYMVPAGNDDGCTPGSCSSGVCGMSWTPQPASNPEYLGTPITRHCGTFQGYWTIADWVNYVPNNGTTINNWGSCDLYSHYILGSTLDSLKPVTQPTYGYYPIGTTNPALLSSLYACQITSNDSLDSGYDSGKINACGCYDWNNPNNFIAPQASNCQSFNPMWTSYVFDRIKWLKLACPTAYSYQFDDTSSQFTCNVANQQTAYQITYCPGSRTGAPG